MFEYKEIATILAPLPLNTTQKDKLDSLDSKELINIITALLAKGNNDKEISKQLLEALPKIIYLVEKEPQEKYHPLTERLLSLLYEKVRVLMRNNEANENLKKVATAMEFGFYDHALAELKQVKPATKEIDAVIQLLDAVTSKTNHLTDLHVAANKEQELWKTISELPQNITTYNKQQLAHEVTRLYKIERFHPDKALRAAAKQCFLELAPYKEQMREALQQETAKKPPIVHSLSKDLADLTSKAASMNTAVDGNRRKGPRS